MGSPLAHLRQLVSRYFNLEELRTLCFDLGINYGEAGRAIFEKCPVMKLASGSQVCASLAPMTGAHMSDNVQMACSRRWTMLIQ
jgi:hypothetical protein